MEYLILLGIQGLKRVLINNGYTRSKKVQQELDDFEISNNSIYAFIRECEYEDLQIENQITGDVFDRYQGFCIKNIIKPLSKIEFSKQICNSDRPTFIDKGQIVFIFRHQV